MTDHTRKDALARVIACRLYALSEQQLEIVDRETTRMVVDAIECGDAGSPFFKQPSPESDALTRSIPAVVLRRHGSKVTP